MTSSGGCCAFCGAGRTVVTTAVLDEKWSRRFGGEPVVALDHGWYRSCLGQRVAADRAGGQKTFRAHVRALCDYCAHGWVEDVRWRSEPALLALAEGRAQLGRVSPVVPEMVRWAQLTAMLAELLDGMPCASSAVQRHEVRTGGVPDPDVGCWFFSTRQRLPARLHLSQIAVPGDGAGGGLVQVVSVELAHLTTLVVLPSTDEALGVVRRSRLEEGFGQPGAGVASRPVLVSPWDLAVSQHPHRTAVDRMCAASTAGVG